MASKPPTESRFTAGPPDPVVGLEPDAAPENTSDLEGIRQALAELRDSYNRSEERNRRLESELKENQRLVQELMKSGSSIDLLALETKWRAREAARRRIYAAVAGKRITIRIHREKDNNRNFPVHLNLNGEFYNVPRGVPYEIKGEFLEVLDHAMVQTLAREVDSDGSPRTELYDLFSYPYEVLQGLEGVGREDVIAAAA